MSVQLIALLSNIALVVLKFVVGNLAHSRALIADGYNSAGDVLTTFVAWLAFRYGRTPADADHPYGHGNAEALAGLLIGAMLVATGAFITIEGVSAAIDGTRELLVPGRLALWAAGITIVVKAALWAISIRVGRRHNSPTLLASAADHRADVITGSVALLGIALARSGLPWFDAASGIAIGIYIARLGGQPLRQNLDILMHREPPGFAARVEKLAAAVPEVRGVYDVRVQPLGGDYRVDLVLMVDGTATVHHGHEVANAVERRILDAERRVFEVVVHVEPHGTGDDLRHLTR